MTEINALTPSYAGVTHDRLEKGERLHWPVKSIEHAGTPILHIGQFTRGKGKFMPDRSCAARRSCPTTIIRGCSARAACCITGTAAR